MGWYVADEGAVRSKGTMYFVLHQHGLHMVGRWVGLSYDGPIISGWGDRPYRGGGHRTNGQAPARWNDGSPVTDDCCEVIITAEDAE